MELKFHSCAEGLFGSGEKVRAFLYTDYEIEPHDHDFYEMNIVFRGEGIHRIEDATFKVSAGDVFMIPPDIIHAYYNTNNLDVFHIVMRKKFILDNQKEAVEVPGFLQFTEIEPFLRSHFPKEMFLQISDFDLIKLKSDLNLIDDSASAQISEPLKEHIVWKILYQSSEALYEQINFKQKNVRAEHDKSILSILEYIHKNYDEKITIDTLCKKEYISRSTLLRKFHDMCGCSPTQYINEYRCKKALELLENKELSKTQVAHNCGFYDLSHMERILKKT